MLKEGWFPYVDSEFGMEWKQRTEMSEYKNICIPIVVHYNDCTH